MSRTGRRWTMRRVRALIRHSGPTSLLFRRRLALMGGAILVGLAALVFAWAADESSEAFEQLTHRLPLLPLLLTPLGFAGIAWITRRYAPFAGGSGIPQVIAATRLPEQIGGRLVDLRTALLKVALTLAGLLVGASVGREGPTVQISAAILARVHSVLQVPLRASVMVAGGAAGVAAAFNTPLAGISFAIEELASAYEQRMTLLVITAVIISGMVSLGLAGDYVYFGAVAAHLPLGSAMVVALFAGVLGGLSGGLFARLALAAATSRNRLTDFSRAHPIRFAACCGAVVAIIGVLTNLTWGTSYAPARHLITGGQEPLWFAPAKFVSTLATSISGIPGGIFAPSLATGAGFGNLLRWMFPEQQGSAVVLLGMVAYFTGVVRAPLTAVIIISETTGSRGFMLPLLGAALVADGAAQRICKERLYHGLSRNFLDRAKAAQPG
ncbi:chloride channel protein [Sphingobium naphthae]|jgi:H+/Cl- antiporter ClcA|uniref:Chloride channel protein n=1 Tax=Sphingobium naphthae TaxID=1886786 RepID=A0ABU3ZT57_9SPHN|nr:chloride channel protein [Sphingobium naphthae]MCC4253193.1 chloride channel protein [Sphingobium naphthae]MDV5822694.1 chloride channel protein [Sphingobium naphthae]